MPKRSLGRPTALVLLAGILKRVATAPTPRGVHRTRTTIRRVETVLGELPEKERPKKLLRQLAAIRRSAGKIRDIDVHLDILRSLHQSSAARDVAQVKNYLGKRREKRILKLVRVIKKQFEAELEKRLREAQISLGLSPMREGIDITAIASQFIAKSKGANNVPALHRFRLECKRLRYTAELAADSPLRTLLLKQLTNVQDVTGEWHDTLTLSALSEELLGSTRPLISILTAGCRSKVNEAMRVIPRAAKKVALAQSAASAQKAATPESANPQPTAVQEGPA